MRIAGQAPLGATVYELDRLRCNLCGELFTAPEPEGIGPEKHDETTAALVQTNQPPQAIGDWHYWVAQGYCL